MKPAAKFLSASRARLVHKVVAATLSAALLLLLAAASPLVGQTVAPKTASNATTTQGPALVAPARASSRNCSDPTPPCTSAELAAILQRLARNEELARRAGQQRSAGDSQPTIRQKCVRQLIEMIRSLAAGELEMKTLLEFASSVAPLNRRLDLNGLKASYAGEKAQDRLEGAGRGRLPAAPECADQADTPGAKGGLAGELQALAAPSGNWLGDEPANQVADDKSRFLSSLVANVDHWLDTLERFTATDEWAALLKVFRGTESILRLLTERSNSSAPANQDQGATSGKRPAATVASNADELPGQVQTLASALNQLLPWHVWPWNNVDLFATVDTFLNHGIFAFSRTTAGPERRIDYLSQVLETLFQSLKYDSFPKKCADWSRVICDRAAFHERLALAPAADESPPADRRLQVERLLASQKNVLTQELTCIMFSSLSLQQFGAKELPAAAAAAATAEPNDTSSAAQHDRQQLVAAATNSLLRHQSNKLQPPGAAKQLYSGPGSRLDWHQLVRKALHLYGLSREALTDAQWVALYQQLHELWSQMKISQRVIMVGRVVQLITNCHMPREILESALWKDIYKYKNVLNQMSDIVIDELNKSSESGQFSIEQLALGSRHLEAILRRFLDLLPKLIDSLSGTLVDRLPDLVSRFFAEKSAFFKAPCKGHSFARLIPNLERHQLEIEALERLVCEQLDTKPNITMVQINNLTYEFLAMAFNFSGTLGGSLQGLPTRFRAGAVPVSPIAAAAAAEQQLAGAASTSSSTTTASTTSSTTTSTTSAPDRAQPGASGGGATDGAKPTSIVDELAANPRLAQIVAILQSSPLDPPEVHAELPELDWVEAGTSVALLYETIQKLISHEGPFAVFPELERFQDELQASVASARQAFRRFGKQEPIQLVAYGFDALMPLLLRTFQPLDSFHQECLSTFYDIFGRLDAPPEPAHVRESRQWQCAVSSANFALHSLNNLIRTFNSMLRNILRQMSRQRELGNASGAPDDHGSATKSPPSASAGGSRPSGASRQAEARAPARDGSAAAGGDDELAAAGANATCVLFDGSVSTLMDNLPLLIDLTLETVLIASTNAAAGQQAAPVTLKDTLCLTNHTLDPFGERQLAQRRAKLKVAVCHLLHESSLATCSEALRLDEWSRTMRELNATWFEASAASVEPSFRAIIRRAHEFLDLFGRVKPSSMSDGLIARVLNLNSYWTSLVNKIVSSVEKYRRKRFELALQVLIPIVYDNLEHSGDSGSMGAAAAAAAAAGGANSTSRTTLKTFIMLAKSTAHYVENSNAECAPVNNDLRFLFDWADRSSALVVEVVLKTLATNTSRLEELLVAASAESNSSSFGDQQLDFARLWARFCANPVETFLEVERPPANVATNKANLPNQAKLAELGEAKEAVCKFDWRQMQARLLASECEPGAANGTLGASPLDSYTDEQLIRILLTKWGQLLDLVFASGLPPSQARAQRLPKFLSIQHWQPLQERLAQIAPAQFGPTDLSWIWQAFERLINRYDSIRQAQAGAGQQQQQRPTVVAQNQTLDNLLRVFEQLNCALDSVKGGLTWDNLANIYQDRQDILAAHSTINNGIALASAGANTFLAHKKFQRFLDDFVRPRAGLNAFCDTRDRAKLESIFAGSTAGNQPSSGPAAARDASLANALESFQELICDTNIDSLAQNLNPISACYQMSAPTAAALANLGGGAQASSGPLASLVDRFFKLASLAILDAKLVDTDAAKPQILDKSQWDNLRDWWLNQTEAHQGNSGLALTLVRLFQTTDSINANHVVWKALFRSVHELSEVAVYLIRAAEMESQAQLAAATDARGQPAGGESGRLALVRETARRVDQLLKVNSTTPAPPTTSARPLVQQQQLASTLTNVLFPEANNFISFKTFKQLRYVKSIADYFVGTPGAQQAICANVSGLGGLAPNNQHQHQRFELIGYKLDSSDKLTSLLCHYEASQWLTTLNIVLSSRTSSLSKKVNYMTKYLSSFVKRHADADHLQSFIHGQQLENIEAVANSTVSYLIALSQPFKTLSLSKISNISWHSLPALFDSINDHLCASKFENQLARSPAGASAAAGSYQLARYEPRKPELETIVCKLPTWNVTQIYDYFSENFDLQNMISLVMQNNRTASVLGISTTTLTPANTTSATQVGGAHQARPCITPFKFASKWLKIVQDLIDELMSKASRDKLKRCFGATKKNASVSKQALRYVKLINNLLSTVNDLTVNNSWGVVRKAWSSISYALLNQSLAPAPLAGIGGPAAPAG